MKINLANFFILFSFLIVFILYPNNILADGAIYRPPPDPYSDRWDHVNETNQQAFISYEAGIQKMLLSVGMENNSDSVVWIFPVPGDPQKIIIDVLTEFPQLKGEDINLKAQKKLVTIKKYLNYTQIYPLIPEILGTKTYYRAPMGASGDLMMIGSTAKNIEAGTPQDVVVYEHLEKEGLTTELVTSKSAQGLIEYLKQKNLNISEDSIPSLRSYMGQDFSFVVTWIKQTTVSPDSNEIELRLINYFNDQFNPNYKNLGQVLAIIEDKYPDFKWIMNNNKYQYLQDNPEIKNEFVNLIREKPNLITSLPSNITKKSGQKGVFVSFPTNKIYYPLIPTNIYGSNIIPANIRVIGFVSPKVYADLKTYTKTSYYVQEFNNNPALGKFLTDYKDKKILYTKIDINAPSKLFSEDLWITNFPPVKTYFPYLFSQYPSLAGFLLLAFMSVLISLVLGFLMYSEARNLKGFVRFFIIGLGNCFSLIGLAIVLFMTKLREISHEDRQLIEELKKRGYSPGGIVGGFGKKLLFILIFSIIFLALNYSLIRIISNSL